MFVKPAAGLRIPDPSMRGTPAYFLPPEGREVVDDLMYWTRRIADGDAFRVEPGQASDAPADGVSPHPDSAV